ncbi:2-hydroxyacyl-CoA dehydratase, partial [bacterium]|nr:2-hydroxyacyl-CoA dehydratase [bacterium]
MTGKTTGTEKKKSPVRKIESNKAMRELMGTYFGELFEAAKAGSPKIAWCTSVGPAELVVACGFRVYFPENHGAMLGASRMATDLIPAANAIGYSPEICSYLTSDIGSFIKGETPMAKMP